MWGGGGGRGWSIVFLSEFFQTRSLSSSFSLVLEFFRDLFSFTIWQDISLLCCSRFFPANNFLYGIAHTLPPRQNFNGPSLTRDLLSNLITFFVTYFKINAREVEQTMKKCFASMNSNHNCKRTHNWTIEACLITNSNWISY